MRANIVRSSAFCSRGVRLGRLDAEYVDPDILSRELLLQDLHGALPLRQILDSNIGIYIRPKTHSDSALSYVAIDNIDSADGFIFHQVVPESELPTRAKYRLQSFDLVLSNVRPERGGVGLVLPLQSGALASSGTTVLRIPEKELRNVVFAFMRSDLARMQLVRRSRGSMYPAITKDDVPEVFVPSLPPELRRSIDDRVESSIGFRDAFSPWSSIRRKQLKSTYVTRWVRRRLTLS